MHYSVVIVAAGQGSRMGLGYNKVYYRFKDGESILEKTMNKFLSDEDCCQVVVVSDTVDFKEQVKLKDERIVCTDGGSSRQESVAKGLALVNQDKVMIHDGARPYVSLTILNEGKKALEEHKACCVMVPCKDTIARVREGYIVESLKREELMNAQTPQAFDTTLIKECIEKAQVEGVSLTDDCSAVRLYSEEKIKVVMGDYRNLKITTVEDL